MNFKLYSTIIHDIYIYMRRLSEGLSWLCGPNKDPFNSMWSQLLIPYMNGNPRNCNVQ